MAGWSATGRRKVKTDEPIHAETFDPEAFALQWLIESGPRLVTTADGGRIPGDGRHDRLLDEAC